MKVMSIICAVSLIALGLIDGVLTCAGFMFPSPLKFLLGLLCVINTGFLMGYAKRET